MLQNDEELQPWPADHMISSPVHGTIKEQMVLKAKERTTVISPRGVVSSVEPSTPPRPP